MQSGLQSIAVEILNATHPSTMKPISSSTDFL